MTSDPSGTDSAPPLDVDETGHGPNRRQVLALAGGTAAVLGLGATPFSGFFAGAADGEVAPEISLTAWLVGLELAAVSLYDQVATDGALDTASQTLATTCVANHGSHQSSLAEMVSAGGGTAPTAANQAFLDAFQLRIDGAADGAAKAAVLAEMEDGFAATYLAALQTATRASLASVIAQILATDATHAVAWSAAAEGQGSENPLPSPDAVPETQTDEAQFTEATYGANPPSDEEGGGDNGAGSGGETSAESSGGPTSTPDDAGAATTGDES